MPKMFFINSDISKAETLPATFYKDKDIFENVKEKIFLKTWQWIGDENLVKLPQSVYPLVLLDNYLTEPLVIVRNEKDEINCFTNVCTHRGNLVALHPGTVATSFTEKYVDRHPTVPAKIAARNLIAVMDRLEVAETGGFFDYTGAQVPW